MLSGVALELTRGALPAEATVVDLGSHRLKDLERAEHVYQVAAPGLATDFPPLRSEAAQSTNLPLSPASIVGRDADLELVCRFVRDARLVSVCGLGGVGKTRLAIEAARTLADSFPDGTWLVELAPVGEPGLVSARVGAVFGMREQVGTAASDAWITALHDQEALLVLDNCEHVLDAAAAIVSKLLHACPKMHVLVTSREPLRTQGEGSCGSHRSASRLTRRSCHRSKSCAARRPWNCFSSGRSVRRRLTRAASATNARRAALVTICRRLDGIPLALELAAARARTLGLPALARRLDDRFRLLAGGDRTALPRQQTLRAALDWSFELLDQNERRVLQRLSVFAGTFTLEAAQEVCSDDTIGEWDVVDALASLVDKSLVGADPSSDVSRYSMLETPRAYARERLIESGERAAVARKHLAYDQGRFERFLKKPDAEDDAPAQLEADLDNARAALDWAFGEGTEPVLGAGFARTLHFAFESLSLYHEGLTWLERALAALPADADKGLEAALLLGIAKFQSYIGSPSGFARGSRTRSGDLPRAQSAEAARLVARLRGVCELLLGQARGRAARCRRGPCDCARARRSVASRLGALRRRRVHRSGRGRSPADALARSAGVLQAASRALPHRTDLSVPQRGRVPSRRLRALAPLRAARRVRRDGPWTVGGFGDVVPHRRRRRGLRARRRRRRVPRRARSALVRAPPRKRTLYRRGAAMLAGVAAKRGDTRTATRLLGASDAQFAALGRLRMPQERYVYERTRELLQADLGEEELMHALEEGARLRPKRRSSRRCGCSYTLVAFGMFSGIRYG